MDLCMTSHEYLQAISVKHTKMHANRKNKKEIKKKKIKMAYSTLHLNPKS